MRPDRRGSVADAETYLSLAQIYRRGGLCGDGRAALVGRMVLSTVHTNDSLSAVLRLIDLNVPPYLVAATLRGVLSQRLVRTTCRTCQGAGCAACAEGVTGRSVVSELLEVDQALEDLICRRPALRELRSFVLSRGFKPLQLSMAGARRQTVI